MSSSGENKIDLDLQAFRYVGNDMADDERRQFEECLVEDQAAREAVARAVQIGQAVAFSRPLVTREFSLRPSGSSAQSRRRFWAIVASSVAAAFLAGVGIAQWFDLHSSQTSPIASSDPEQSPVDGGNTAGPTVVEALNGSAGYVLALWSESAAEFGQSAEELANESEASQDGGELFEMTLAASEAWVANDEAEFNLPSWMLAAVSPDDEPDASQPDAMPEEN